MSTPQEEDVLREHALQQIIQQIKVEFEKQNKPLPSEEALRVMAKKRHDNRTLLT